MPFDENDRRSSRFHKHVVTRTGGRQRPIATPLQISDGKLSVEQIERFVLWHEEIYLDIRNSKFEVSNFGKIRKQGQHDYFGRVLFMNDLRAVVNGEIDLSDNMFIGHTAAPDNYFTFRARKDKEQTAAILGQFMAETANNLVLRV